MGKDSQVDESANLNEPDAMADAGMTDNPAEMFATDDAPGTDQGGEPAKADPDPEESGADDAGDQSTDNKPTIDQGKGKGRGKGKAAAPAKADPTPAPEPKVLTFRGEKLTAEQLADRIRANPELAEDLTQTYAQFPAIQRKHIEALEAMRAASAPRDAGKPAGDGQAADGQPAPGGAPMDPAKALKVFQEGLAPRVQQLVDRGLLSADTVEVNPDLALLQAYTIERLERFGSFEAEVNKVWGQLLLPMFQAAEQANTSNVQRERDAKLDDRLKALAGTDEALSPLADTETRNAYIRRLRATVKADDEQMSDEFLSDQFMAFHAPAIKQALKAVSEARGRAAARDARASAGESSGPTGRPTAKSNQDILDLFATGG